MKPRILVFSLMIWLSGVSGGYGTDWCVQVSTFRHLEGIQQDFHKVKAHHESRIEKIGGVYSLRTGFYETEGQAKEALKSIKEQFPKAFVRKCDDIPARVIEASKQVKTKRASKETARGKAASSVAGKQTSVKANEKEEAPKVPSSPAFKHTLKAETAPVPSSVTQGPPAETLPTPPPSVQQTATPAPGDLQQLFEEAERQRGRGQYAQAIDHYKKVGEQAPPGGDLAGRAAYRTAFCRDAIGEKRMAEGEYAQAIEKWPGLDIAPAAILFAGGMKAYKEGRYESALKVFSLYGTVYPDDVRRADYMMACSLMRQGRYNPAMMLFGRIMERYPDSSEAMESMVALGNMGVVRPKIKATMFMTGYEWYFDPIDAYNTVLKKNKQNWAAVEHIFYAKGYALMIFGRHEEAQKILVKCLQVYPSSPQNPVYKAALARNAAQLFKIYYEREDYAGVVGTYFQASGQSVPLPTDADTAILIGRSLYRVGLIEDAVNFLKAARIKASGKDAEEIGKAIDTLGETASSVEKACEAILQEYRDIQGGGKSPAPGLTVRAADCLYQGKQYADSIPLYDWALGQVLSPNEKRWALLRMGQAHLKSGKDVDAKKVFDQMKMMGEDEFWSKMADFAYEDGKWTEKYKKVTKKK